ncbi:hypothetical protein ACIBSW_17705 [Actinoplanes sp. NPDC049668]|uniref:hypothetical protein n=1 Tax=unclassified Actinoplanes TaxID=2626549 RepID=UPI0033BD37DF
MLRNLRSGFAAMLVVLAVGAGVNVVAAAPAAAVGGWSCSGLGVGFGHDAYFAGDITISGIKYGEYRWGVSSNGGWDSSNSVAVLDTRADGKPPYVYISHKAGINGNINTPRLHNYQGVGGGWECHQRSLTNGSFLNPYTEISLWASVDNAPSVPNLRLARWYVPGT